MIRSIVVGVWICIVTVVAGYSGTQWKFGETKPAEDAKPAYAGKLAQIKLKPLNVPVVVDGAITGYVMARLTLTAPAELLKQLTVKPDVFLLDAAFHAVYSGRNLDIKKLSKKEWTEFSSLMRETVNARYGLDVIHDVLIEELGFIPADEVRGARTLSKNAAPGERAIH